MRCNSSLDAIQGKLTAVSRRALGALQMLRYPQVAVVAAGFLGILYLALSVTVLHKQESSPAAEYRAPERVAPEPLRHRSRKVYPLSVVPGGIYDASEVRERMKSDPVVFAHYQGVKTDKLIPIQLASSRKAYVSYRRGNRIYWTKRPVKIAAGETVWTDGKSKIRARCGNMLAENPQLPTYWMDPQERHLNQADPKLLILPLRAAAAPIRLPLSGGPEVEDPGNPLFAPIEDFTSWFPPAAEAGVGPNLPSGSGAAPGPSGPGDPGTPPVTPPGPNPPGPNPPGPEPPGPNPPGPNPPGPNPPGPNPPDPNPPGPNPPPVTPPGPNPPGPNPPGPNPPGPNPPGPNPPGPNPPGPNPPGPNPPGPNPPVTPPLPPGENPPNEPPGPPGPPRPPGPPGPPEPPGPPGPPNPPDPPPPTPVPEPSTYLMIGAGLAAMAYYRKRRGK